MALTIVEAAKQLGNDNVRIDSYTKFDKHKQYWVFTKNPNLLPSGQARKPSDFPKPEQMNNLWEKLCLWREKCL